ncbi:MAG: dihydrofolate reductase family protein [Cyclobacteriaceae bacterium]
MRKVKMYIAISLDGKIADEAGGVGWLDEIPLPEGTDYGYGDFIKSIDTTIMGNSTYQQVLSFPVEFPYKEQENFVYTKNQELTNDENVTFVSSDFSQHIKSLKQQSGKDIWLIGGGQVNTLVHNLDLVDEYWIFVMPVILGAGIPLFADHPIKTSLQLIHSETYDSGVTFLHYSKS